MARGLSEKKVKFISSGFKLKPHETVAIAAGKAAPETQKKARYAFYPVVPPEFSVISPRGEHSTTV